MSQYYTFDAFLSVRFEEKTITSLINKGKDLGFMYLDKASNEIGPLTKIPSQEAINILLTTKKDRGDNFFSSESLKIKYKDTFFTLWMYESNFSINIHILALGNIWKKTYGDEEYVDIGRDTQILIDLCEDFPIMQICTEIE